VPIRELTDDPGEKVFSDLRRLVRFNVRPGPPYAKRSKATSFGNSGRSWARQIQDVLLRPDGQEVRAGTRGTEEEPKTLKKGLDKAEKNGYLEQAKKRRQG
jgi:hypothetical protein